MLIVFTSWIDSINIFGLISWYYRWKPENPKHKTNVMTTTTKGKLRD